jgi:hypothetical protein
MPVIAEPASRAFASGSRRRTAALGGALVLIAAIGLLVGLSGSTEPRHPARMAAARYGGLPSY